MAETPTPNGAIDSETTHQHANNNTTTNNKSLHHLHHSRHSTRVFKPDPVPPHLLHEAATLAQRAPSNSNIQPWRLTLAQGPRRDRIVSSLHTAAQTHGPNVPPLPPSFTHYRSDFGHLLYGNEGYAIPRGDKDAMAAARMRNFRFFDAPVVGVVSMDAALEPVDALTVGMFVQVFLLALVERGVGSCCMVSVTGFPEVLREGFGLGEGQRLLTGIAIGFEEEGERVNAIQTERDGIEKQFVVLED